MTLQRDEALRRAHSVIAASPGLGGLTPDAKVALASYIAGEIQIAWLDGSIAGFDRALGQKAAAPES